MDKDLIHKHRENFLKKINEIKWVCKTFEEYYNMTDEEFHNEMTRESKGIDDFMLIDIFRSISSYTSSALDQFMYYSKGC